MITKKDIKTSIRKLDNETLAVDTGLYLVIKSCTSAHEIQRYRGDLIEEIKRSHIAEVEYKLYGSALHKLNELEYLVCQQHFNSFDECTAIRNKFAALRNQLKIQ